MKAFAWRKKKKKKKRQEDIVTSWNYIFAWRNDMEILEVHELYHRLKKKNVANLKPRKYFIARGKKKKKKKNKKK